MKYAICNIIRCYRAPITTIAMKEKQQQIKATRKVQFSAEDEVIQMQNTWMNRVKPIPLLSFLSCVLVTIWIWIKINKKKIRLKMYLHCGIKVTVCDKDWILQRGFSWRFYFLSSQTLQPTHKVTIVFRIINSIWYSLDLLTKRRIAPTKTNNNKINHNEFNWEIKTIILYL